MVAQHYVLFWILLLIWEGFDLAVQSTKTLGNLSLQYLFITLTGILAIISGLLGEGIFLYIAVSGPLILFCIGLFLIGFTIEARHASSQVIDSYIIEKVGNLKSKETRIQLSLLMLISGTLIFLISIYHLSSRNYSLFALFLSGSSLLFALTLGRTFVGRSLGESDKRDSPSNLQSEDLDLEYSDLRKWLKTDWDSNLSKYQEKKIEEQKTRFLKQTRQILADPVRSKKHILALQKQREMGNSIEMYLFGCKEMKNAYTSWLNGAISSNERYFEVMNSLRGLLLLPSIIELSKHIFEGGSGRTGKLSHELLSITGIIVSRLNCYDLIGGEDNISMISAMKENPIDDQLKFFIYLIANYASKHKDYLFSPWWLLNLLSRMQTESPSWDHNSIGYKQNFYYVAEVIDEFSEWCYILSEMDVYDTFPLDNSSKFSSLFLKLKENHNGLSINNILQITWMAYKKLK